MRESSIAKTARPWERAGRHLISLLLGGLFLVPPAAATDIPFYVSSKVFGADECFLCAGPWLRSSGPDGPTLVQPGTVRRNFYTAETTIFPPFGHWTCWVFSLEETVPPTCVSFSREVSRLDFCLIGFDNEVDLTIQADRSIAADKSPPPCLDTAAAAFLGDATAAGRLDRAALSARRPGHAGAPPGRLDRDAFRFDGEAGETITVMLERDGASGSTGEIAELTLRGKRGPALDEQSGALPLELTVTLPETGSYEIEASEVGTSARGSASPFRGHYLLTVTSSSGEPLLEPAESTEP